MADYQTIDQKRHCLECSTTYWDSEDHLCDSPIKECSECDEKFNEDEDPCDTGICLGCRTEEPTDLMDIIAPIFKDFRK